MDNQKRMKQSISQQILLDQGNSAFSGNLLLNLQGHSDLQEFLFELSTEKRKKKKLRPGTVIMCSCIY